MAVKKKADGLQMEDLQFRSPRVSPFQRRITMRPIRFVFLVLMLAIGVSDSAIRGMFSVRILPIGISRYQRGKTMRAGCF